MNNWKGIILIIWFAGLNFCSIPAQAQCSMCKSNVEMARKDGGTNVGNTLNNGILYLLALPYTIAGVFGIIYYRKYKEKQAAERNASKLIS